MIDVVGPALGAEGLRALHAQVPFPLPDGGTGRMDFALERRGVRVAIEIDGLAFHEGPGEDGLRPERERARQNALAAAGYTVLRFTAREVMADPEGTRLQLKRRLADLGVLDDEAPESLAEPLPIAPRTHALLGAWPRAFVRAQQAALDLLRAAPGWPDREARTALVPRADRGATVLGLVDALDACASAHELRHAPFALRRLRVWVGDDAELTRALLDGRRGFPVEVLSGPRPDGADLLLVSATAEDLTDAEVTAAAEALAPDARVVWCSDVDATRTAGDAAQPRYFERPERAAVERLLDRFFGFEAFREGQWEIVAPLLRGESTLGVLPTGAGKTVCFQLPALLQPGLAVVASPLRSLMDDQVMNLRAAGLDFAGRAHSGMSPDDVNEEIRRLQDGSYKLFYVSPERFHSRGFVESLAQLSATHGVPVSYFVVDEAHLASEWGHDFRPSYLTLPEAREALCPAAPLALLTATAPRQIRSDLGAIFGRSGALKMVLPPTFDRPELSFAVRPVRADDERLVAITGLLRTEIPRSLGHRDFSDLHGAAGADRVHHGGLVFTPWGKPGDKRKPIRAADLAQALTEQGLPAAEYRTSTTETESDDRTALNRHTQERFKRNELPLVVATKGFGTGIDKPDIRYVVHADMPGSLEALYQEAGRAGRDAQDARSVMVWRPRPDACRPEGGTPACATSGRCPHGLAELCSFGIQARLRIGNQPGSSAEIEASLTLWREYIVPQLARGEVIVPRSVEVAAITRAEVIDRTQEILGRLARLGVCGEPSVPREAEKPLFVKARPFSRDVVVERARRLQPGAAPQGASDESFLTAAVRSAFGLPDREAQIHTAVWAMYVRNRDPERWSAVPRPSAGARETQRPEVERFLARLVTLRVARSYRYHGKRDWAVELAPPAERTAPALARALAEACARHGGAAPPQDPLPDAWREPGEVALTSLIQSWYETIAVRSWETLESLEEFARARDCRRRRIATYMNESAVSIPSPCGHCDNCGVVPLGDVRPVTVDDLAQRRIEEFNRAFDAVAEAPDDLGAVDGLVARAREHGQLQAVRDRAARHLERAPFDLAPRLAAALAANDLGEPDVAARHARAFTEALVRQRRVDDLLRAADALPLPLVDDVLAADALLAPLADADRERVAYALERRAAPERALRRAARRVRRAAQTLTPGTDPT